MSDMTTTEAAAVLNRSSRQIINLIHKGELQGRRFGPDTRGGRWMVDQRSVERLKAKWEREPPKPGRQAKKEAA